MMSTALNFGQYSFASIYLYKVQIRRGVGHAVLLANIRTHNTISGVPEIMGPEIPSLIHFSGEIRNNIGEHLAEIGPVPLRWYGNRPEDEQLELIVFSFRLVSMWTCRAGKNGSANRSSLYTASRHLTGWRCSSRRATSRSARSKYPWKGPPYPRASRPLWIGTVRQYDTCNYASGMRQSPNAGKSSTIWQRQSAQPSLYPAGRNTAIET